ncbi:helix-turn-helix domain-containing protein [Lederbergia citrea]|uniref:helix-turn-helix domain-containing protein n=1 Tax=Lederbergia citrea TaxID=2833581 RepID=UPI001BC97EA8|nr:helix-turn-helix domain-containing protein [Lederbergia citrea]MBS4176477.1 helix-turn-helix domain-containing protein [Lederbergia citrea]MBS4203038.1 helix-turn-helix domain-containing protein [Lederbergia citrea]
MTFLQAVILECLQKINGERTIYSIYHLLTGKKSSQTIQDAHLFQLTHLFKTLPGLKRQQFNAYIDTLHQESYLNEGEESTKYFVSDQGYDAYMTFFQRCPMPEYIQGLKLQDATILMWKRLTLLIQAASHLIHSINRYYPIQRDPEIYTWVRDFLTNYRGGRSRLSKDLFKELHTIFSTDFPENPFLIVARLSGWERIGLTGKQTAEQMGLEETEYHYRFLNGLHFIIQTVTQQRGAFPILNSLITDVYQKVPYTKSTFRTYELLQQDFSILQIAAMRGLKESTVEDHIIEIALSDRDFSIDSFIDQKTAAEISDIAKRLGQRKLKPIKEQVQDISYFQIRLVLARAGEKV